MEPPKIYCPLKIADPLLSEYLQNVGALVHNKDEANVIITDEEVNFQKGKLCFLIGEKTGTGFVSIAQNVPHQDFYQKILQTYTAFANANDKPVQNKYNDHEEAIIAGFARHFSHNVLNALLSAGGFLRQLKAQSDNSGRLHTLWNTVEDRLRFIEELVTGYNDYHHALKMKLAEEVDIAVYFQNLIMEVSGKTFSKAFSAYLGYQTDNYDLTYSFGTLSGYTKTANPLFLKLAFCYILKDTIRYVHADIDKVKFHVTTRQHNGRFVLEILVLDINLQPDIIDTMLRPWDHYMFMQSFDYWGVVVAQSIVTKHEGKMNVLNSGKDLLYILEL